MGSLFVARADDAAALAAARAQFAASALPAPRTVSLGAWTLLHSPYARGGPATFHAAGADCVAVAGTLTWDGMIGADALAALLPVLDPRAPDWTRLGGHFVLLLHRAGATHLLTDYLAAGQLFHDRRRGVFSTALLATLAALPHLTWEVQGLYEHAFNVVPVGDDTVFEQVKTLGPRHVVELVPDGARLHDLAKPLPAAAVALPAAERLERHRTVLDRAVRPFAAHFGRQVHCPLSGGLDSRLLLGALRAAGSEPAVYVYGPPTSSDVAVARTIGARLSFPVDWIEKERDAPAPDAFPAIVARNFAEMDGLPTFGNIFDNGGNLAARDRRHADGWLAASGGCGEVYRDFFFLPDRATSAATIARTFFARFLRRDATAAFDPGIFLDRLAAKIADALGVQPRDRLPRTLVEQVYPRVRCRALFGREIALEGRQGAYLMPFLDHHVVAEALTLPVPERFAGRFEAALMHAVDPILAAQPSAYGHHFAGPPSRAHRLNEWQSRARPIWLRQRSYALQRRLRPLGDEHGGFLTPEYMGRVLDPSLPAMRRYFNVAAIRDTGLWRRLANLEYLAQQLGSKLQ